MKTNEDSMMYYKGVNIAGKRFGKLVVLREAAPTVYDSGEKRNVTCRCDCGNLTDIGLQGLARGKTPSCGCAVVESATKHGLHKHKLYGVYQNMRQRCYNKMCPEYKRYGGRGITICDEWLNDFMSFYNWANSNGYKEGLSIDKVDNGDIYKPSNCRWATNATQSANQRVNSTNKSGYTGVSFYKKHNNYRVYICHDNKNRYLGSYTRIEDAVCRRNKYIKDNQLPHPIQQTRMEGF
jgi:hypothetical protein